MKALIVLWCMCFASVAGLTALAHFETSKSDPHRNVASYSPHEKGPTPSDRDTQGVPPKEDRTPAESIRPSRSTVTPRSLQKSSPDEEWIHPRYLRFYNSVAI